MTDEDRDSQCGDQGKLAALDVMEPANELREVLLMQNEHEGASESIAACERTNCLFVQ